MPDNDDVLEILKTMMVFDLESDVNDDETVDQMVNYFREVLTSDNPTARKFMHALLDDMGDILVDLRVVEPEPDLDTGESNPDEDGDEFDDEDGDSASFEVDTDEEPVTDTNEDEPEDLLGGLGGDEEENEDGDLADDTFESVERNNPLVEMANRFNIGGGS